MSSPELYGATPYLLLTPGTSCQSSTNLSIMVHLQVACWWTPPSRLLLPSPSPSLVESLRLKLLDSNWLQRVAFFPNGLGCAAVPYTGTCGGFCRASSPRPLALLYIVPWYLYGNEQRRGPAISHKQMPFWSKEIDRLFWPFWGF